MFKGEICKFVTLADSSKDIQDCIKNYDTNKDQDIADAGFHYDAFCLGLFAPGCLFFIEFFLNQIQMSWKQIVH